MNKSGDILDKLQYNMEELRRKRDELMNESN